jgi:hypothetical protein
VNKGNVIWAQITVLIAIHSLKKEALGTLGLPQRCPYFTGFTVNGFMDNGWLASWLLGWVDG